MKQYTKEIERVPEKLPIAAVVDRRSGVCSHYANKVWRHTDPRIIAAILENLYEQAYSNGLRDMDKMHDGL